MFWIHLKNILLTQLCFSSHKWLKNSSFLFCEEMPCKLQSFYILLWKLFNSRLPDGKQKLSVPPWLVQRFCTAQLVSEDGGDAVMCAWMLGCCTGLLVAMPSCGNAGAGFLLSPVRRRNAASTFPGRTTCPVTDHCSIYWITAWMIHYIKIPLQLNCFKWRYSSQCLDVKGKTTYPATMCALQRKNERLAQEVRKCDCVDSERE